MFLNNQNCSITIGNPIGESDAAFGYDKGLGIPNFRPFPQPTPICGRSPHQDGSGATIWCREISWGFGELNTPQAILGLFIGCNGLPPPVPPLVPPPGTYTFYVLKTRFVNCNSVSFLQRLLPVRISL